MEDIKSHKPNWLIFANTEAAEIYEVVKKNVTLVKTLTHPQSRLKAIDLMADE